MSGRGGRGRGRGSSRGRGRGGDRGRGRGRGRGDNSGRGGDRPRGRGRGFNPSERALEISPQSVEDSTVIFDDEVLFERITPEQLSATKIKLLNSVSSSLIKEPRFNDKESITHVINRLVKKVAFYDPEFILKLAVYTRDDLNIRSTSNYLISLASNIKQCQPFLKKYFKTIVRLPSDWLDVAATYQALPDKYLKEKSLPTSLRKAMVEKFPDFDVYQLGKYNKERSIKRKNKKAKDSGSEKKSEKPTLTIKHMIRQLHMSEPTFNVMCILGKKYPPTEDDFKRLQLPGNFEPAKVGKRMKLPVSETWETMLSEKGNRASTWEELIEHNKLPFMAMLRNIRNLILTGVHPRYHKWVMNKLTNENAVSNSRQFPTRFFSAYEVIPKDLEDFKKQLEEQNKPKTITITSEGSTEKKTVQKRPKKTLNPAHNPNPSLFNDYRKALDTAVKLATIHNIKPIRGSTVVFCNASADMNTVCTTAKNMGALNKLNEVGVLLGLMCKYACEECDFRVFSSPSATHPKGHLSVDITDGSILENVQTAIKQAESLGTATQFPFNYLEDLIREKKKIDNLIVLSHETIAPGKKETMGDDSTTISNILKKYRQEVNKDLLFVSVDLSGRGVSVLENDSEKHPNDILVSGFTDSILRFIAERGDSNQLQYVENIDIAKGIASKKRSKTLAHFEELDKLGDLAEEAVTHAPHPKWRTAKVFISSTFLDMHSERDILTRHVFPELRERCKKINVHIAEVDLRWGVTEEETQQNKSVEICLDEIDNCRPFFVGLLGNRYGWIPKEYGVPDEPKFDWLKDYPKGRSITELEIQYGALQKITDTHAFFYLRDDPTIYKSIPEQYRKSFIDEEPQTKEKLANLKTLLKHSGKAVEYKCTWAGVFDEKPMMKGLESFRKRILEDLWTAICKVYAPSKNTPTVSEVEDKLALERSFHFSFMEARCRNFIGRKEALEQLEKLVEINDRVLVVGKPGAGKSALVAKFIKDYMEKNPKVYILPHFIGASPTSMNIRHVLFRICSELVERFGIEKTVTDDYKELLQLFPTVIEQAAFKSRILLVIDGLDQLTTTHRAHTLDWLPPDLPIKIIVSTQTITATSQIGNAALNLGNQTSSSATSTVSSDGITYFIQETIKRRGFPELIVGPLSVKERRDIVKETLAEFRKKLDERPMNDQMRVLLKKTDADKPLYLIIACQELRVFGVYEQLTEKIKQMGPSVPQLLQEVLARAEQDHGKETIKTLMSLIVCARNGLLESEILELLKRKNKNESILPRAIWSTLFSGIQWFLRPVDGSGEGTLDFLYKEMTKAVKKRYFEHDQEHEIKSHRMLAEFFYQKAVTAEQTFNESNTRAISEVPYHLLRARVLKPLHGLLCNLKFVETKCRAGMVYDLLTDYFDACDENVQWKGQERDILDEFRKYVTANSHILANNPDLTYQQAMNSPDNSPIAHAAQAMLGVRNALWMKWMNKPQMQDPVKMTLKLTDAITCCNVSSDGTKIVCATKDCIIRIFNAQTGMEVNGLIGHSNWITSVSFSPDNQSVLSSSWDQSCKVWDASTGLEQLSLSGHNRLVNCARFSPDGKYIVSGSWDCTLKLWENIQGKAIKTLRGHTKPVNTCEFSADGNRIVSGSWDGTIKIWDALTAQVLSTLTGHSKSVRICHFSPNGKQVISAAMDATLKFWDSHAGKLITSLSGHSKPINTCSFSTDGQKLVSGGDDNMLIVWDAVLGKQSNSTVCEEGWMNCINYSPDGKYLITSGSECFAALYDANDLSEIRRYIGHTRTVNSCIFNPVYNETIATASDDGLIKIWDRDTATCVMTLKGHRNSVNSCDFSPDGAFLVTSSDDFTVKIWDTEGQNVATLTNHTSVVKHAVFSPNGKYIASTGRDNVVNLYNANSYKLLASFKGHLDWINFCSWSPDSKKIVSGSWDYNVKVWDVKKGKEKYTLVGHGSSISTCLFSKDGKKIISSAYDGSLKVWDAKAGTEITSLIGHEKRVNSFAVSPNDFVASVSDDCTIRTWDPLAGIELSRHIGHGDVITGSSFIPNKETSSLSAISTFEKILSASEDCTLRVWETHYEKEHIGHSKFVNGVAFNRNGGMMASVSDDKTIKLWNPVTLKLVRTLIGHDAPIRDCAFSPDGSLIATVSDDNTAIVWDISKGKIKTTLSGHTNSIRSVAYSSDGQQIATASWDQTARVWSVNSGSSVTLRGHTDWVTCVVFTPDRQVITGSCDNTLILWNVASQSASITFRGHENWITAVSLSPDGNVLLSGDYDGIVKGWEIRTGVQLFSFAAHDKRISSCRFSADGSMIFSGSYDGNVRAWSNSGKREKLAEFSLSNPCTSFSASNKLLCIADSVGQLYVLSLAQGKS